MDLLSVFILSQSIFNLIWLYLLFVFLKDVRYLADNCHIDLKGHGL